MSEIRFYQLADQSLEGVLPKLLEKILDKGLRAVVKLDSAERVDDINALLWTYSTTVFLPHGAEKDGHAERQPIWLTTGDDNPNGASVLVLTQGVSSERIGDFSMCLEIFDGNESENVTQARERWRSYREAGHDVSYYKKNPRGGWEQQS